MRLGLRQSFAHCRGTKSLSEGAAKARNRQFEAHTDMQEDQRAMSEGEAMPILRIYQRPDPKSGCFQAHARQISDLQQVHSSEEGDASEHGPVQQVFPGGEEAQFGVG